MFGGLANHAPDYAYMDEINVNRERASDMVYVNDRSPYVSVGIPDFLIDPVAPFLLRLTGMTTEDSGSRLRWGDAPVTGSAAC
jgi:hypothetical protein